jgi:hypothetical protein
MKKLALLIAVFLSLFTYTEILSQGIPKTINYQGILKDGSGAVVPNNDYNLTFKLYDAETGGTVLWTEYQLVYVDNGILNVQLGTSTIIPTSIFNNAAWLGISIEAGTELTPRIALSSVPYSFISMTVPDGSLTASKIADDEVVKSLNGLRDNVNLVAGSNVTITPSGNDLTISSTGAGSGIGGSGTANYLPVFTNSTTLGSSSLYQNAAGKIGIGTTNPIYSLDIRSDEQVGVYYNGNNSSWASIYVNALQGSATSGFGYLRSGVLRAYTGLTTSNKWFISTGGSSGRRIVVDETGNVGIGTDNPNSTLEVAGTAVLSGTENELNRTQTGDANLVPIAYANVNADGTLNMAATTTNVSLYSHSSGSGNYYFTIDGFDVSYLTTVCVATINSDGGEINWGSAGGGANLLIQTRSSTGTSEDKRFTFVVYKK